MTGEAGGPDASDYQQESRLRAMDAAFRLLDSPKRKAFDLAHIAELNAEVDPSKFAFPRSGADLVRQKAEAKAGG